MEEKKKYRIGIMASIVLVISALIADLLGIIPFVQYISAPIFWIIASIYFWSKGMGLLNGKKLASASVSWLISVIPALQMIPLEIVGGIIAIIIITRIEDRTGISLLKPLSKGIRPPRLEKNPLNAKEGIRPPRLPRKI